MKHNQAIQHRTKTLHVDGGLTKGGGYAAQCNCGWQGATFWIKDHGQLSGEAIAMADHDADDHVIAATRGEPLL